MPRKTTLAFVLAGGKGERLYPLTRDRAKSAVPFGGMYRVIDFVLSNLYHSGIRKICVLTQYQSESLHKHIKFGWYHRFGVGVDEEITVLPATQSASGGWYEGTADAIAKHSNRIRTERPNIVNIFGGDHIYLMDIIEKNEFHLQKDADLTISAIPIRREDAVKRFGVLSVDENYRLIGFEEKPENPKPIPGNEEYCLASMGNYAFKRDILLEELAADSEKSSPQTGTGEESRAVVSLNPERYSTHDFGFDIIPEMLRKERKVFVYNFNLNTVPGVTESNYWRDIGDLDQFYGANMDIRLPVPLLNLYNEDWPIFTFVEADQPAKFVGLNGNPGSALDSIVANGVIVSHSRVERSILSYKVKVDHNSYISESILLGNNIVGKNVTIKKSIIDKDVKVPDNETVGVDAIQDRKRGFMISPGGITVVPKAYEF